MQADSRWSMSKTENYFKNSTLTHAAQTNVAFEKKIKKIVSDAPTNLNVTAPTNVNVTAPTNLNETATYEQNQDDSY